LIRLVQYPNGIWSFREEPRHVSEENNSSCPASRWKINAEKEEKANKVNAEPFQIIDNIAQNSSEWAGG